ncbi:glycosyltransferase [Pseudonocardia ailaonensis]|uniref:Glycosyltransferase n=1 Tax=Pseudonocardia ailaonensis TaxID=367279 RepID=A0ABN2NB04_9PSEU
MKVLHVIDSFSYGGAERLLATMNSVAPAAGLQMRVASLAPFSPERSGSLDLLTGAGLEPSFVGVRRLLDPKAIPLLRKAIRESGADVVHAHLGYSATLVPIAARLAGVPCVSTLHHLPAPTTDRRRALKEKLWTRSAERGAALVFVSEAARAATAQVVGRPKPTWRVLPNGVDMSAFRPVAGGRRAPLPPELGIPDDVPVVTVVAALRRDKGHAVAVEAWPKVRAQFPDAVLLIVGDGDEAAALRARDAPGVVLAGARDDVPDLFRGSTLALLPSFTEALPTALIEAAACGVAVVATTVGGTAEIVEHGRTGLLVPPRAVEPLADAIGTLLGDASLRARFGEAGRQLVLERFELNGWVRRIADLYEEAAGQRRGRLGVVRGDGGGKNG